MVFARTPTGGVELIRQFKKHTVDRAYVAIAHGNVVEQTIDTLLVRDRGDGLRGSTGSESGRSGTGGDACSPARILAGLHGSGVPAGNGPHASNPHSSRGTRPHAGWREDVSGHHRHQRRRGRCCTRRFSASRIPPRASECSSFPRCRAIWRRYWSDYEGRAKWGTFSTCQNSLGVARWKTCPT